MKKRTILTMALAASLLSTVPVSAATDKEILFRDIPWGTNYTDITNILPDFDWNTMSYENMRTYPVQEVLTDDDGKFDVFVNGNINMIAYPFTDGNTEVAGYTTSDIELYFAYTPVDGQLQQEDSLTALYGARYIFDPQNLQSMYDDLTSKLSSLYGEPDDVTNDKDWLGLKYTHTWWHGANDTVVVLHSLDSSEDETDLYEDELWIAYAWEKGDDLLKTADDTISQTNSDAESQAYGNGATDGL